MSASAAPRRSIALDDSRPIWQSLAIFLVPLTLSNFLQALGQTANSIYLGRMVGVKSLAAVSAIFPIVFFLVSFVIGLGSGSSVLIGQAFGARDERRVREVAGAAIALSLLIGAIVGTAGAIFAHELLAALGTPADILATSTAYARIVFFSMPVLFLYLMYTTFLRGTGDTKTPFYILIASTLLVFGLTPAFIAGWFGLPALGTNGAAVANVLSNALSLVGLAAYLLATKHPLAPGRALFAAVRLPPDLVRTIARIGVPTSINLVMVSLSEIAVLTFVNRFGSPALAAYGAVNQISSYVQFPAISIAIAASIFGAQSIGAARFERIPRIARSAIVLTYVVEGVLIAIVYAIATPAVEVFVHEPHTVALAQQYLWITMWGYALFGNARVLSAIMVSSGTVVWPTLLSIVSIWGVQVPVAYVLMGKIGLDGVWWGYPAAYAAGLAFQTAYYRLVWKRRPLRKLV